jgi:hypothetical protein
MRLTLRVPDVHASRKISQAPSTQGLMRGAIAHDFGL